MKTRSILTALAIATFLVAGSSASPATAAERTTAVSATTTSETAGAVARGPVGPCVQQPSGIRAYISGIYFVLQNCNTVTTGVQIKKDNGKWDTCKRLAPGREANYLGGGAPYPWRTC